jgi:putative acetyltransferase
LRIRPYRAADRDAVIALFRDFMQELRKPGLAAQFDAYIGTAVREELGRIEAYYLEAPDQGFWVAVQHSVVGMVGIERHAADCAELRRMAVQAQERRKGIGRALLATAECFAREHGYRRIALSTSELQLAARALYESSGYRLIRTEQAAPASHKSVGAGLARHHYEKSLG